MNPELRTLIENLEFRENKDKPGLYSRKPEETDACGKAGVTAYIDFRRATEKGRRFYTVDGIDGFFDQDEDVNTIPVLAYFKEQRDNILTGTKPSLSSSTEQHRSDLQDTKASIAKPELLEKTKLGTPDTSKMEVKDDSYKNAHRKSDDQYNISAVLAAKNNVYGRQESPISQLMVSPVATIDQAVAIFKLYEEAKSKILSDNDILWIGEDGKPAPVGKGHPHIKRSGWRKLARFFGLSCKIISSNKVMNGDGKNYQWTYHVVATHPSGAYQEAIGVASSKDKFFTKGGKIEAKEENVILKSQTVGFNRAIADLLGCGEISAEELE